MRYAVLLLVLLVPACGSGPRVVSETWQVAYLEGTRVGHTHTVVHEVSRGVLRSTRTLELTVKRYGSVLPVKIVQTCDETPDGKVLAMTLNQSLGKDKQSALSARVEGKKLYVKQGNDAERPQLWDAATAGQLAQEEAFARRKAKPGDRFSLVSYELAVGLPLTLHAEVKGEEDVDTLVLDGDTVVRKPAKLVRAEVTAEKLIIGGKEVQLPTKTMWLGKDGEVVREQFEFPGLGLITQFTTTREAAQKEGVAPELLPDLGLNIMIGLNRSIDRPHETTRATYRVTVDVPNSKPFAEDERQKVVLPLVKSFELRVNAVREPGRDASAASPGKEYTESNRFIDSDNGGIRALAATIRGDEKRPYETALALERWVKRNMTFSSGVGFPPASQVAQDRIGDCRQHALLLAALLRASGIPSRTALGLVYNEEPGKGPVFAFHMWAEAWVGGRWLALDGTQGIGGVGATHLTMVHHSWAGTQTLAPLLPIAGVLGKLKIEVIEAR